jgi:hypothetical protein
VQVLQRIHYEDHVDLGNQLLGRGHHLREALAQLSRPGSSQDNEPQPQAGRTRVYHLNGDMVHQLAGSQSGLDRPAEQFRKVDGDDRVRLLTEPGVDFEEVTRRGL